ncbi:XisI protein [Romeria aff. gracilis LEGE 07310]|uniref:XisI protein n=1 Tax=Vasconcelosia minhoensis LEGE 07310 TaxID=915328 RepID=A0A8J7DNB2_9CYAN|nr:XisI protein [Romeria aff. gracilis LEGE 07310]
MRVGWEGDRRINYAVFHFDMRGENFWIPENNTDVEIDFEFRYYFCQREAVEPLIYLKEVRGLNPLCSSHDEARYTRNTLPCKSPGCQL